MMSVAQMFNGTMIAAALATAGVIVGIGQCHGPVYGRSLQGRAGLRQPDPDRNPRRLVPDLQGAEADTRRTDLGAEVQGPEDFPRRFRCEKPVVKQFKAQMQSTLIVFKGSAEQGRSVGDTKEASIAALLDKSL